MTSTDPNTLLMSGGVPSAKFADVGAVTKGRVVDLDSSQQTDFQTREPKFYDDGNPMMQVVVTLATDVRDPDIDDDDGTRRLYVRGQMVKAVREAVRKAGADGLAVGGTLGVQYTGDGQPSARGLNPPKLYAAQYAPPPTKTVTVDSIL